MYHLCYRMQGQHRTYNVNKDIIDHVHVFLGWPVQHQVKSFNHKSRSPTYNQICSNLCSPAGHNNVAVAKYLLKHGADVNAQDNGGFVPLHNASLYGVSNNTAADHHEILYHIEVKKHTH